MAMMILPLKDPVDRLSTDYGHGILHLAWIVLQGERYLVYGVLELVPREVTFPDGGDEDHLDLGRDKAAKGTKRLFARRIVLNINDALSWYGACCGGSPYLPGSDINKPLRAGRLEQEPEWPQLLLATNDAWYFPTVQGCRVHHLIPTDRTTQASAVLGNVEVLDWLKNFLLVDFRESPELIGSIHLVAPNPVVRSINVRLASISKIVMQLELRNECTTEGFSLIAEERRATGRSSMRIAPLAGATLVEILFPSLPDQYGYALICSERGLLAYSEPTPFLSTIRMRAEVNSGRRLVQIQNASGKQLSSYSVPLREQALDTVMGEEPSGETGLQTLRRLLWERQRKQALLVHRQHWFQNRTIEAEEIVRSIIAKATIQLLIVDPYFNGPALAKFVLAATRSSLTVQVLASADGLGGRTVSSERQAGEDVLDLVQSLEHHQRIEVKIMPGKPPIIHDRFLVVDNEVWFSGNSLHSIGARGSLIVKLPDPKPLIGILQKVFESATPLEEWLNSRPLLGWSDGGGI